MSLRRYTWRAMQQRPGRTILTVLSIVIGVAAAVAIHLGTATTRNAYKQMFAMVTGRATLEVDGKGGVSFEKDLLDRVAGVQGVQEVTLVLAAVEGAQEAARLADAGVVDGRKPFGAQAAGIVEGDAELDLAVAEHVRVGRAPGLQLREERREHAIAVLVREARAVQRNAEIQPGYRCALCTIFPPITVNSACVCGISPGSICRMSRSRRMKSALLPAFSTPIFSSSRALAASRV